MAGDGGHHVVELSGARGLLLLLLRCCLDGQSIDVPHYAPWLAGAAGQLWLLSVASFWGERSCYCCCAGSLGYE